MHTKHPPIRVLVPPYIRIYTYIHTQIYPPNTNTLPGSPYIHIHTILAGSAELLPSVLRLEDAVDVA